MGGMEGLERERRREGPKKETGLEIKREREKWRNGEMEKLRKSKPRNDKQREDDRGGLRRGPL